MHETSIVLLYPKSVMRSFSLQLLLHMSWNLCQQLRDKLSWNFPHWVWRECCFFQLPVVPQWWLWRHVPLLLFVNCPYIIIRWLHHSIKGRSRRSPSCSPCPISWLLLLCVRSESMQFYLCWRFTRFENSCSFNQMFHWFFSGNHHLEHTQNAAS